jgi:hypothetical protein
MIDYSYNTETMYSPENMERWKFTSFYVRIPWFNGEVAFDVSWRRW